MTTTGLCTATALLDSALALARQGYAVFPLGSNKRPCRPSPGNGRGGFHEASTIPARVRELFASPGAVNVGVVTGAASGIDVLDLDPRNGSEDWFLANERLLEATRVHLTPGKGMHWIFKHAPGVGSSHDGRIGPGCDVKGDGGYVVWYPAVGGEVWMDEDIAEWPAPLLALARQRPVAALAAGDGGGAMPAPPPRAEAVVDLLNRMPNPLEVTYDTYVAVMHAARGCVMSLGGDDAGAIGEAAAGWAEKWQGASGTDERQKWEDNWSKATAVTGWEHLQRHAAALIPGYAHEIAAAEFPSLPLEPVRAAHALFVSRDYQHDPDAPYVVKRLLAPGDVGMLLGAPGAGKSTAAVHLGYAVAKGMPVFGARTRATRVLYVVAEDFRGVKGRLGMLGRRLGHTDNVIVTTCGNLNEPVARADLFALAVEQRVGLLILDTVAAAFAGFRENESEDMGTVVAFSRKLAAAGMAVLLIHHPAKNGDGSPRGHSSLNRTLDMVLTLAPDDIKDADTVVRGGLLKNRNGSTAWACAFLKEVVELGTDSDGERDTTTLVREVDVRAEGAAAAEARRVKLTDQEAHGLRIVQGLEAERPGPVTEVDWRAACIAQGVVSSASPKVQRDNTSRIRRRLIEKGAVVAVGDALSSVRGSADGSEFLNQ